MSARFFKKVRVGRIGRSGLDFLASVHAHIYVYSGVVAVCVCERVCLGGGGTMCAQLTVSA